MVAMMQDAVPPIDSPAGMTSRRTDRHAHGTVSADHDRVVVEEPLEIRARGRSVCVTMRTPGDDEDLAVGFLLGEGIIRAARDVVSVEHCARSEEENVINVVLAPEVALDLDRLTRHVFTSSSCGLCGKATIASIRGSFPPVESRRTIGAKRLTELTDRLRAMQRNFAVTGGLHAAGLFRTDGECLVVREDVGRHNAVDKVLGHAVRACGLPLEECILLVSGRVSFEIVQKALAGGVPIVAAVSAPSSLAIDLAHESGQTLVGFLRDGRFNTYAHGWRIRSGASARDDI